MAWFGRSLFTASALGLLALSACEGSLSSNPVEQTGNNANNAAANNTTPGNNTTANNTVANNTTANNTTPGNNTTPSNDPDPTCENYCSTVMANCSGADEQYGSEAECLDYCNNVGGWEAGTKGATDGDTIACRIYHGNEPAKMDSALHCPHAGPSGGDVCGSWCDVYCALSEENCSGANQHYADTATCMSACEGFDASGSPGDAFFDTVQCRIYHLGAPAAVDPDTHCPHGGEVPTSECVGSPDEFAFRMNPPGAYTRVDRMGMPAVATVLITSKDEYNAANPSNDTDGMFTTELVMSLTGLHMALDDDLAGLSLTPCTTGADGSCVSQGGPLIVPDTITIFPGESAGFPNGRKLDDQVVDLTLAVILLDLSSEGLTTFADIPLNPDRNDKGVEGAFLTSFPYLHPPHQP